MKKLILSGVALSFAAALNASTALADITIATVGPITGSLAALGEQYKRGAEMAVADINAAGGINGEKLVLEIGDDACDPKQAVAVANQMASKGVKFVAGHLCSGSSIPASKVYEEEGILMISPASTNPTLTDEGGWNVHRVCGRDDAQGAVAAAFIAKNFAGKKVAVIDDKSAYGKGLADVTRKELAAANFEVALSESFTAGEKDYTALVSKMKDAGVEAVYIGGYHPEEGVIARQMAEQGLKAQIISGDSMNNIEFWTIAGTAGEGLIFTFAPEPRNIPAAKAAIEGKNGHLLTEKARPEREKACPEREKACNERKKDSLERKKARIERNIVAMREKRLALKEILRALRRKMRALNDILRALSEKMLPLQRSCTQ